MIAAFKGKHNSLDSFLDKSILTCFKPDNLARLLASPDIDLASVKGAFTQLPNIHRATSVKDAIAAGLDPLLDIKSLSAARVSGATGKDQIASNKARLDPRFKIGFSRLYGHAVELNRENSSTSVAGSGYTNGRKVESGTYVFEQDEMPYACVIEKVWKGRLCEECLRGLPVGREKIVECPACAEDTTVAVEDGNHDTSNDRKVEGSSSRAQEPSAAATPLPTGPARFCSRECLETAWKTWHGYECGAAKELRDLKQLTRLALRIYWQNTRHRASIVSKPSRSPAKSDLSSLTSVTAGLSLENHNSTSNSNAPRINGTDGSDIMLSQLCDNFSQLDSIRKTSFLLTGYYLHQLLDLPEDAAVELAHLQALVQFNSFAVKSQNLESSEASESMAHVNDYVIGSALYLLASMFNHSCAPNAMAVFGKNCSSALKKSSVVASKQSDPSRKGPDPRVINVLTNRTLKIDPDLPVQVEISYGPQGGRMATEERKECLRRSHLFECNCSACNDRYAEAVLQKAYKCPKNGYACRPMTEKDKSCPTCGIEIDMPLRRKMHQLMARLITESQAPSLSSSQRLALLKTLESTQSKIFVDTCILYGNTCDQLAMVYAESGDLKKSIEWCKKALKVVVVHFPHDSIEVAQETLKLAGLLFNNMQVKEAMKQVQIAITLYKGHFGANSRHPDLLELYEMEKILRPLV
ncbi:SET and MYND domain-containing protein 4 [Dissophora ornata]|nr:SET and MYND domain-containing protein 4 [Dissophora ornata]